MTFSLKTKPILWKYVKSGLALIFLFAILYFAYIQNPQLAFTSLLFGFAAVTPLLMYGYLIPLLSKMAGPLDDSDKEKWPDDLLTALGHLLTQDPEDDEIEIAAREIKRSGVSTAAVRSFFEGPMTIYLAPKLHAAAFAFADIYDLKPAQLREALSQHSRSCSWIRRSPLWLLYKYLMPSKSRAAFYEALARSKSE